MAREYSALYNLKIDNDRDYVRPVLNGKWSVIFKDTEDEYWSVELDDAGDQATAIRIADALNLRERGH